MCFFSVSQASLLTISSNVNVSSRDLQDEAMVLSTTPHGKRLNLIQLFHYHINANVPIARSLNGTSSILSHLQIAKNNINNIASLSSALALRPSLCGLYSLHHPVVLIHCICCYINYYQNLCIGTRCFKWSSCSNVDERNVPLNIH